MAINVEKTILSFLEETEVIRETSGGLVEAKAYSVISERETHDLFDLPGRGSVSRNSCGSVISGRVCKDTQVRSVKRSRCDNAMCPLCYGSWVKRTGKRALARIMSQLFYRPFYHWVVSFEKEQVQTKEDVVKARKQVYKIFKGSGGYCVFHSFRNEDKEYHKGRWFVAPHFHLIIDCKYKDVDKVREDLKIKFPNIVVKRIKKIRKTDTDVMRLLCYELGHMNVSMKKVISDEKHPVRDEPLHRVSYKKIFISNTWFGNMANNKLKTVKIEFEAKKRCWCKICKPKPVWERSWIEAWEIEESNYIREKELKGNAVIWCCKQDVKFVKSIGYETEKVLVFIPKEMAYHPRMLARYADWIGHRCVIDLMYSKTFEPGFGDYYEFQEGILEKPKDNTWKD